MKDLVKNNHSLLGLSLKALKALMAELELPSYVASQIADWMYHKHVSDIGLMKNLSKETRAKIINAGYEVGAVAPVESLKSVDGTSKYLYPVSGGHFVETVYIPDGDRATLCVSSQVGCKMGCTFCMTGRQGFNASLKSSDIINQIYSLPDFDKLTNVVFMGQGEPFDNLDEVLTSLEVLTSKWGFSWSPKRITVSSVGLKKGLKRFLDESSCHLAISLHHPIPSEREKLMPAEKAYSIVEVVEVLKQYDFCRAKEKYTRIAQGSKQRRLSFEYIVFDGINDSIKHAQALLSLLKGLDCRINLIRFHDIPNTPLRGASEEKMLKLRDFLTAHGLFTTIRASRGEDIFAACGLLSTIKQEEGVH